MSLQWEQVVVDAKDPVAIGQWWADVLGWVVLNDSAEEFEIVPAAGQAPGLIFVPVPEGKDVKNRLHLDFRPDDQDAEVVRLLAAGAHAADVGQDPPNWVVLADPEGNEFCVLRSRARPSLPSAAAGAHVSKPNTAQAQRWNGSGGQHWVTHQERHAKGHQHLIPHLFRAAAIGPGDRVLDIGCGCGGTTIAAARAAAGTGQPGSDPARPEPDPARPEPVPARPEPVPARPEPGPARPEPGRGSAAAARNGSAFGLDLSGPMLAVARQLAADADLANVVFEQGDAQVYPLPRGHYDVMISSFGVMFFDDAAAAFANIVAALRDRGRLAFLCWQDDLRNELFSIPLRAFGARTPPLPSASGLFADPRQVTELLSGAGCADIQVSPLTEPAWMGTDVADVMAYVREMSMVTRLVAELGDQARAEQALAAMAEQYAARQRPDGVWVATAAWLVTARRG